MPTSNLWVLYALLGALFAGVVQVLSKPAGDRIGPNPVSLIRAAVMVLFFAMVVAWSAFAPGKFGGATQPVGDAASTGGYRWPIVLAFLAGVAASLSWFFGYKALKLSAVANSYSIDKLSLVFGVALAMIFLGERPTLPNYAGIALMLGGAYLVTLKPA